MVLFQHTCTACEHREKKRNNNITIVNTYTIPTWLFHLAIQSAALVIFISFFPSEHVIVFKDNMEEGITTEKCILCSQRLSHPHREIIFHLWCTANTWVIFFQPSIRVDRLFHTFYIAEFMDTGDCWELRVCRVG